MTFVRLVLSRIAGNPFRSTLLFLCVVLVTSSTVWATLIVEGVEENLRLSVSGMENLGVEIIVIPRVIGFSSTGMGNVNLVELLDKITAIPGVERASPQLLVSTLSESKYCSEPEMFLVVFDPVTDFLVLPRLQGQAVSRIGLGEAVAGSLILSPDGRPELILAGYKIRMIGQLPPTGTSLDQSLFITLETTQEIARQQPPGVNGNSGILENNAPYILVKVEPGIDPQSVALLIRRDIPGVTVFDSTNFFREGRDQMTGLLRSIPVLLGIGWGLAVLGIGLIFSIAVNEHRREIGVLRALGFPRLVIFWSLLAEGFILALVGSTAGTALSFLTLTIFQDSIVRSTGLMLSSFSYNAMLLLALESLGVALASVFLAAIFPAWRISQQDPAVSMRG